MEHLSKDLEAMYQLGPGYLDFEVLREAIKNLKEAKEIIEDMLRDFKEEERERIRELKAVETALDLNTDVVYKQKRKRE